PENFTSSIKSIMAAIASIKLSDGKSVKLGRIRLKNVIEDNRFKYLTYENGTKKIVAKFSAHYNRLKDFPPPPATVDYSAKALQAMARMYLNDQLGDCVIASKYHALGIYAGNESGADLEATDTEVDNSYVTICGPGDQGCDIPTVLDYWKSNGLIATGKNYKLDNYVAIDWTNQNEVMVAIDIFGAGSIGINLPNDWTNAGPGVVWTTTNSQIVGGHDVVIYGYNSQGVLIGTWGKVGTLITWSAFTSKIWLEECYAQLSPLWYQNANLAPNGISSATLLADLTALANGTIPSVGPTPPTPPVVPPTP